MLGKVSFTHSSTDSGEAASSWVSLVWVRGCGQAVGCCYRDCARRMGGRGSKAEVAENEKHSHQNTVLIKRVVWPFRNS